MSPNGKAKRDAALVGCFLLVICLPLAGMALHFDAAFTLEENRRLATRPELKLDRASLARFPAEFEAFFNDQFGFRKRLIKWLNLAKVAGLGVSPSPKVILGRDGWLFYGGDIDIPYYRAIEPLTAKRLDDWQKCLESRRDWLAARGIPYLVVVPPLKNTIYAEYMPRVYNRIHTESMIDQLLAHMKAHSSVAILDLREALRDEKSRNQVYYRTDTHWNNRGAYVGYTRIMESLRAWFPQLEPIDRSQFQEVNFSEPGRDLPLLLGMRDYFWENYVDLNRTTPPVSHRLPPASAGSAPPGKLPTQGADIVFEQPDQKLPAAVMFRDSFATWLEPLLSEHFRRIVFSWQYTFDRDLVEREKPDVVIQEMVERAVGSYNDDAPPAPAPTRKRRR